MVAIVYCLYFSEGTVNHKKINLILDNNKTAIFRLIDDVIGV